MHSTRTQKKALCRLRISAHDLQIERGRYANIAREDRKCRTCGVVEGKLHFLNDYTRYDLLRQRLLDNPNMDIFCRNNNYRPSDLLQLDKSQMYLAEYVYNCMSYNNNNNNERISRALFHVKYAQLR